MPLIDHVLPEELLQDPPFCLDVVVVQRDIGMIHIRHVPHPLTHIAPHSGISEDGLSALLVEFPDSVALDVLFAVESQLLLDFNLHRKAVGIPACLSVDLKSLHRLVAVNRVLQRSSHHVMDARFAVGSRRPLIEDELRLPLPGFYALVEQILLVPFFHLFLLNLCDRLV